MLVIYNARVHTLNPIKPFATSLAIDHGEIVAIGMDDEILSTYAVKDLIDASGCAIIPSLTDAHIHLKDYAFYLQKIDCETPSREECLQRVAELAKVTPPGEWILGHGWNQNNWVEGYGSAALLDEIAPQNPVYLTHKSLHSGWANSYALRLASITINSPDPPGGTIRRLQSGEPDGILLESATDLLEKAIPEPSLEKVVNALRTTIPLLYRMGLTGIHDFSHSQCFSALQILHQNHELKMRVVKGIPLENLSQTVDLGLRTGFGDDTLRIGPVKLFSDGALGPHTAAMEQPYEDEPGNLGILTMDAEQLYEYGQIAVKNGICMAVHAIGDRANHEVLNAYTQLREFEHALPILTQDQLRHRIEHVQVIHPDDAARFAELGIIASMQPIHATSDMLMADRYWGSRSASAYAWRSQLAHGATLVFGSDAPVESPNPFWGVHAAVTRRCQDGSPSPEGWYPEQRLSVDEALHAFTTGPAYAAGMENRLGILAAGYLADLLILNIDPFTCLPEQLVNIEPLGTMIAGEWVYSAGI
jgi:predicted amidohydrolase YtcJ